MCSTGNPCTIAYGSGTFTDVLPEECRPSTQVNTALVYGPTLGKSGRISISTNGKIQSYAGEAATNTNIGFSITYVI